MSISVAVPLSTGILYSEEVREALFCGSFLLSTSLEFLNISHMLIKLKNALVAFLFLIISV